ncbi:MAG: alpha/beta hydrolase [Pseudomonadota bacterium]|nr:alpha/beta hydrolase [Pseudomonadota bacterium]
MMLRPFLLFLVLAAALAPANKARAQEARVGVVLMHGKGSTALPKSPVGKLAAALEGSGILVAIPDMPWSKTRNLAKDHDDSMLEIDEAVAGLKAQGAALIVVGGHSMGGNAALGYGARREGLAGVMVLAGGHVPDVEGYQKRLDHDWKRAAAMVARGEGDRVGQFQDNDQNRKFTITTKARDYLSWFSPDGPAAFPKNAAALKPGTPLLWVVGTQDFMFKRGEGYAFARAPKHANSLYLVINGGGHIDSVETATPQIIEWLKALPPR